MVTPGRKTGRKGKTGVKTARPNPIIPLGRPGGARTAAGIDCATVPAPPTEGGPWALIWNNGVNPPGFDWYNISE